MDLLESRLEAAEVEHIGVRKAATQEKERAEKLEAALEAERAGRRGSGLVPSEDSSGARLPEAPSAYRAGRGQLLIPFRFVDGIIGICQRYTTHR